MGANGRNDLQAGPDAGAVKAAHWRPFPLFGTLGEDILSEFSAETRIKVWSAGEVIFRRGDASTFLVGLSEGRVKLSLLSAGGRELLLRHAGPGDLLGEIACLDGAERSADATTVTRVTGLVVTRETFRQIARRHPALYEAAIVHLGAVIRGTNARLESISLYDLRARIARFFLLALHHQAGHDTPPVVRLAMPHSQSDLALLLGASRPKVNGVLQEFRKIGALVQAGAIWHCDMAALYRISDGEG